MAINKKILILLTFIIIMVNSSFRCNKGIDCTENIYSFNLGIKAYPDKDSIEVGDTLWLEVNEPTTLKDFRSGNDIDYSGAENLGSVISFHELSTDRQLTIPAIAKFNYNLQKGVERNVLDPSFEKQYLFIEEGKFYKFKLGLIAREKGIFGLIVSNAANVYRKSNKCAKASFGLIFKNTNQHYNLNPNFQGGPIPVGGDYYFKVY